MSLRTFKYSITYKGFFVNKFLEQFINYTLYFLLFGFFFWLFSQFIVELPITPIDDTCVYFNYAKNLVAGNLFAYDARNIPSEGFTSLIFLILLVPFEYFGINLLFAAIVINIAALLLVLWTGLGLYQTISRYHFQIFQYLFVIIFAILLILDHNLSIMIGMGFESILSPAFIFISFYFILADQSSRNTSLAAEKSNKSNNYSFIFLFLATLIRPENVLITPLLIGIMGLKGESRRNLFYSVLLFGICFALYFSFKLFYFNDIFPTAYYRKFGMHTTLAGYEYVFQMLHHYANHIFIIFSLLATLLFFDRRNLKRYLIVITLFIGTASILILFFLFVNPIVGYGNRFLVVPIVIIYFLLASLLTLSLELLFKAKFADQPTTAINRPIFFITLPIFILLFPLDKIGLASFLPTTTHFYETVHQQFEAHPYVKFGRFLKQHLLQPQQNTLVFGDAGCIPYTSDLRFIDSNGLTEPYIAHLFKISDKKQAVDLMIKYILQQHPDIIVIHYGKVDKHGAAGLSRNPHSPLGNSPQLAEFQAYRDHGFQYLCSLPSGELDVHLAVNPNSPQANQLIPVILEYCKTDGYFLAEGLTKRNSEGSVWFPRHQ
jgi:hypothetical protein